MSKTVQSLLVFACCVYVINSQHAGRSIGDAGTDKSENCNWTTQLFQCPRSLGEAKRLDQVRQLDQLRHKCPETMVGDLPAAQQLIVSDSIVPLDQLWVQPAGCRRYIVAFSGNGLGHCTGAIAFAANLALEFGYTLALHDDLWLKRGMHGVYSQFRQMLGLTTVLAKSELHFPANASVLIAGHNSRESFVAKTHNSYHHRCNQQITLNLGGSSYCYLVEKGRGWCFESWKGAYARARRLIRRFITPADPAQLHLYANTWKQSALAVAWHIRCGDIILKRERVFFERLRSVIEASGVAVRHYIFEEKTCPAFSFLADVLPKAHFVETTINTTVLHMAGADVLVHTGSSLVTAAALVARGPQLYFQAQPKERGTYAKETYAFTSGINVELDGRLSGQQYFIPFDESFDSPPSQPIAADAASRNSPEWLAARQVGRYLRAIHAGRFPKSKLREQQEGNSAADEARELGDLVGYKVISVSLVGRQADIQDLERLADTAAQLLPGWMVRVHYNSSARIGGRCWVCLLRAWYNVELVDMATSRLSPEWWPYAPALEGEAVIAAFITARGGFSEEDWACSMGQVGAWQRCGGPLIRSADVGCRASKAAGEGIWGVRQAWLGMVRTAVLCAAARSRSAAADALRHKTFPIRSTGCEGVGDTP